MPASYEPCTTEHGAVIETVAMDKRERTIESTPEAVLASLSPRSRDGDGLLRLRATAREQLCLPSTGHNMAQTVRRLLTARNSKSLRGWETSRASMASDPRRSMPIRSQKAPDDVLLPRLSLPHGYGCSRRASAVRKTLLCCLGNGGILNRVVIALLSPLAAASGH